MPRFRGRRQLPRRHRKLPLLLRLGRSPRTTPPRLKAPAPASAPGSAGNSASGSINAGWIRRSARQWSRPKKTDCLNNADFMATGHAQSSVACACLCRQFLPLGPSLGACQPRWSARCSGHLLHSQSFSSRRNGPCVVGQAIACVAWRMSCLCWSTCYVFCRALDCRLTRACR